MIEGTSVYRTSLLHFVAFGRNNYYNMEKREGLQVARVQSHPEHSKAEEEEEGGEGGGGCFVHMMGFLGFFHICSRVLSSAKLPFEACFF